MSTLAPTPAPRRFPDLMALGRARLPSLAPDWTDHNAHDPGITLMELLAWVSEAEIHSASRMRRDERAAYAALLGVAPRGTQPARGVLWRDPLDPSSPAATFARSVVIDPDAAVSVAGTDGPVFRPGEKLLFVPGRVLRLESVRAGAITADHTVVNASGGPPFLPLGASAGPRDLLRLTYRLPDGATLFPPPRDRARGARWAIGVRADGPPGDGEAPGAARSPLQAALITEGRRIPLPIVSDTTRGLLATGVLLLDLDRAPDSVAGDVVLELRARGGLPRPPRLLRVEPSVVPIEQGRAIVRELHGANGRPDWGFALEVPGLRFGAGEPPVRVEVTGGGGFEEWRVSDDLAGTAPNDIAYEIDYQNARVTFGNGFNGRVPPAEAQVLVSYRVSEGAAGAVARNRKWTLAGFGGVFGVNPDPVSGGAAATAAGDDRRESRSRARNAHALVTADDITEAALALPRLEVARAWVASGPSASPGAVTLTAMRSRGGATEPPAAPETRRWLEAVRRALAPRIPLGTRLAVAAPRYRDFEIRATVTAESGRNPIAIEKRVREALQGRLALVATPGGGAPRRPGVPVTARDVAAWIRGVDGVAGVSAVQLLRAGTGDGDVPVPPDGLPRLVRATIDVVRGGAGSAA